MEIIKKLPIESIISQNGDFFMKPIPTFVHGIFDYIGGAALLFAPEIFQFSEAGGAPVLVARVLGVVILLQSLVTKYELGALKIMPMQIHLMNDYLASAFLVASPWIFGFANAPSNVWLPHLAAGISVFTLTALTRTIPDQGQGRKDSGRSSTARRVHA